MTKEDVRQFPEPRTRDGTLMEAAAHEVRRTRVHACSDRKGQRARVGTVEDAREGGRPAQFDDGAVQLRP